MFTSQQVQAAQIFDHQLQCDIKTIEDANQSQLNSILKELAKTNYFRFFKVNLDEKCPFQHEQEEETCSYKPPTVMDSDFTPFTQSPFNEEAPTACSVEQEKIGEMYTVITDEVDRSSSFQDPYNYNYEYDCEVPQFWKDICRYIPTNKAEYIDLVKNPERYTGYQGSQIWEEIYKEQCFQLENNEETCYEEEILHKLMSGMHAATTIGIAENYYPPGVKGMNTWQPNIEHFQNMFDGHEEWLENLHFSFQFMLKAVYKAQNIINDWDYQDDKKADILIDRFLQSHLLQTCEPVFTSFDESRMFQSGNNRDLKMKFKQAFLNISNLLNCVTCQKCKLHAKIALLGMGTSMKILMLPEDMIQESLTREEVVALINSLAKLSNSIELQKEFLHEINKEKNKSNGELQNNIIDKERFNILVNDSDFFTVEQLDQALFLLQQIKQELTQAQEEFILDQIFQLNEKVLLLAKYYDEPKQFLHHLKRILDIENIKEKSQYDAVIIGGGLAGMSTALKILDRGGKVLLVEKNDHLGGNSALASSGINGLRWDESSNKFLNNDTNKLFLHDTLKSKGDLKQFENQSQNDQNSNQKYEALFNENLDSLPHILTRESIDALKWVEERLGLQLDQVAQLGGHQVPRTYRPSQGVIGAEIVVAITEQLKKFEQSGDLEILFNHKATKILKKDQDNIDNKPSNKAITGIKLLNLQKSQEFDVQCPQIVLASGGFANDRQNDSLIAKYRDDIKDVPTTNGPWATGDGVRLAENFGAKLTDMDKIQLHPTGFIDPKNPDSNHKPLCGEIMRGAGGILLDNKGKRFCNELGTRSEVVNKMQEHGQDKYFIVLNQKAAKQAEKFVNLYKFRGLLKEVFGLQNLAKELQVKPSDLRETIIEYNMYSKSTTTPNKFGKKYFTNTPYEENEKYYYGMIQPVLHYTMGGVKIDTFNRVFDQNDQIIEGLYAVGEVSGGLHGDNRLGGNSLLECSLYGQRLGGNLHINNDRKMNKNTSQRNQQKQKGKNAEQQQQDSEKYKENKIQMTDLQQRNGKDGKDIWISLNGTVYDFTQFVHPGGEDSILNCAGQECKEIFEQIHNYNMLKEFQPIGILQK